MKNPCVYTAASTNPAGNGVILAGASGLNYVSLQSLNPLVIQHDTNSSLELAMNNDSTVASVSALAWKPDSSVIAVGFSNGSITSVE